MVTIIKGLDNCGPAHIIKWFSHQSSVEPIRRPVYSCHYYYICWSLSRLIRCRFRILVDQVTHETERYFLITVRGFEGSHSCCLTLMWTPLSGVVCVVWFGFPSRGPVSSSFCGRGSQVKRLSCKAEDALHSSARRKPLNRLSPQAVSSPSSTRSLCLCFLGREAGGEIDLCCFGFCERETRRESIDLTDLHVSKIQRKDILALPWRSNQI